MDDFKSWYASKTVWFNVLYFVIAIAATFGWGDFQPDAETVSAVSAIVALVNIVLRKLTSVPIA